MSAASIPDSCTRLPILGEACLNYSNERTNLPSNFRHQNAQMGNKVRIVVVLFLLCYIGFKVSVFYTPSLCVAITCWYILSLPVATTGTNRKLASTCYYGSD